MISRRPASRRIRSNPILVCAIALAAATGCSDDGDPIAPDVPGAPAGDAAFTLQLLHFSDIDGSEGALDDVDAFSALVERFRAD